MFEQNYRRLKHFIWLWGTTCWKSACVIADTGLQLTSHRGCLFITAGCYMTRLFWSTQVVVVELELLSIGCVCCGATVALHGVSWFCVHSWGVKPVLPWRTLLCPVHCQDTTSTEGSRGGLWRQVSNSRQCCCNSAVEEVCLRECEIRPAPLWIWAVPLKNQLCPSAWWPRQ